MNCEDTLLQLDEFCRDELSAEATLALQTHVDQCSLCHKVIVEHREYLQRMVNFEAPSPAPGTNARQSSFMQGFAAASVMAMALFGGFMVLQGGGEQNLDPMLAEWIQPWEAQEVTVVINVPVDLPGAQLALQMPAELRLQGYSELDRLSWQVDLKKGANTLTLPITVQPGTDLTQPIFISAEVGYQNQYKGFQLPVELKTPQTRRQDAIMTDATLLQPLV
jgi:hypothetical protein